MEVQSYQPRELDNAVLNGDGFGLGWQTTVNDPLASPFVYRNILPMWNDRSLPDLCRYIHAENFVVNLRSASSKMPLDHSNCQPFKWKQMLFVHNGLVVDFFDTLHRPIREKLCDSAYRLIQGLTDSEHIFALLVHHLETQPGIDAAEALYQTALLLIDLAEQHDTRLALNIVLSLRETTGHRLIALRYDNRQQAPSLYWLKDSKRFSNSVIITSEGLFEDDWQSCKTGELFSVDDDLNRQTLATF